MELKKIKDGVFWAGAIDWDRRLFDSLVPLPDGTTYNAYLVKGAEKTALLDTVDPSKSQILMKHLEKVEKLDYIICHHAEQDHSGTLPLLLEKYPDAKVLTNPKGKELLIEHLRVSGDRISTVADGESLSLGGKTIEFIYTPWVHWPETMSTYIKEDKVLFSCDMFGSHLASSDIYAEEYWKVRDEAKRYYAEVMMPFRAAIRKNLDKLKNYEIEMIAPSHGPVYGSAKEIMDDYAEWVSDKLGNTVVLAYATMHGSTEAMADFLTGELSKKGITVDRFNLANADIGKLVMSLVDAATLVIGTPTILTGAHPLAISTAFLVNALKPKLKYASIIGSFAWGGKSVEQVTGMLSGLKLEMLGAVVIKGKPREEDFSALTKLADDIAAKHRENNLN